MLVGFPMALRIIHGPPNSGRAGLIRRGVLACLDEGPVLVVPTVDDVYAFERELCEGGAVLGASVMTFGGLFRSVATAAGLPPAAELTPAQRLGAVSRAVGEERPRLGPLGRSARRPGFPLALDGLLEELQAAGLEPQDVEAAAATLEGSAYLGDVSTLFAAYARVRDGLGCVDQHGIARGAIAALRRDPGLWRRPAFLYGFDDLTRNQLDLIAALAAAAEVTVALPYEEGNAALAARAGLLDSLREIGAETVTETRPEAANTASPLLFHLERGFGSLAPDPREPDGSLVLIRSAGERGEAEAIGAEIAKLIAGGTPADEIAVVVRDPARRGPLIASVLESYGIPVALEAELPAGSTATGGALVALLEAELGAGTPADLLRYLRGPSGVGERRVDWLERAVRRRRPQSARAALRFWGEDGDEPPADLARLRAAGGRPDELAEAISELAGLMASRVGDEFESRVAAAISTALSERAQLEGLAPDPGALPRAVSELGVRVWSGPAEGRVRIADPYRLRAARFDCVFVASLQDGEFPRRDGRADPFLSEGQRRSLELAARRDTEAEERYLFHACLALPRRRLFLSYRDSDENGAAEARSPFVEDVRRLLAPPPPGGGEPDPLEPRLTRTRELAQVVHRLSEAPSEDALARAIAAQGRGADERSLLAAAGAAEPAAAAIAARLEAARQAEAASRAPGPISDPAVLERLAGVSAYGGTTLEGFEVCSYLWFVSHELAPEPLDPLPDPLLQGGLVHKVLERVYRERPDGSPLPRADSLPDWIARARELVGEVARERGIGGRPSERAMRRRAEGLVARFLTEEAERDSRGYEPWLLEARFGDDEKSDRPALDLGGWRLHGAIDRVDRRPDGRAVVLDYKLSGSVTPLAKLEEKAKLQLQLYVIALRELWQANAIGGLYHPLRGTSNRRLRGLFLTDAAEDLAPYGVSTRDALEAAQLEALLDEARERGGEIVARMRRGDIRRDPGPGPGMRDHDVCPAYCRFATICRRDRAPAEPREEDEER
jgi:RecB family exonuclease